MNERIEPELKALVAEGRRKGYVTHEEVHRMLPDELTSSETALDKIAQHLEPKRSGLDPLTMQTPVERIDDPVRMYLTQMGEIPLLTREEEIWLAKTIERTRKRYREKLLASGLALEAAIQLLEDVVHGELAFDRTLKVNPQLETGKADTAARLPEHIETLQAMLHPIMLEPT